MMMIRSRSEPWWQRAPLKTLGLIATVLILIALYVWGGLVRDLVLPGAASVYTEFALVTRAQLEERLKSAESTLARVQYQAVLYDIEEKKIAALEAELKLRDTATYLSTRVLARPPRTHYDSLVIEAGTQDGVVVGDIASVHGIALGTVSSVSTQTSVVELFSASGVSRDVFAGSPRAIIVAAGTGGGSFEASVPKDIQLQVGDKALDTRTGLPLAVVTKVLTSDSDATAHIYLSLIVPLAEIDLISLEHALAQ